MIAPVVWAGIDCKRQVRFVARSAAGVRRRVFDVARFGDPSGKLAGALRAISDSYRRADREQASVWIAERCAEFRREQAKLGFQLDGVQAANALEERLAKLDGATPVLLKRIKGGD